MKSLILLSIRNQITDKKEICRGFLAGGFPSFPASEVVHPRILCRGGDLTFHRHNRISVIGNRYSIGRQALSTTDDTRSGKGGSSTFGLLHGGCWCEHPEEHSDLREGRKLTERKFRKDWSERLTSTNWRIETISRPSVSGLDCI